MDVHKGEGVPAHVDRGEGGQKRDFCGRHIWMAPNNESKIICAPLVEVNRSTTIVIIYPKGAKPRFKGPGC